MWGGGGGGLAGQQRMAGLGALGGLGGRRLVPNPLPLVTRCLAGQALLASCHIPFWLDGNPFTGGWLAGWLLACLPACAASLPSSHHCGPALTPVLLPPSSPWPEFRGTRVCDGGLTNFIPIPPRTLGVRVCCFPSQQLSPVYRRACWAAGQAGGGGRHGVAVARAWPARACQRCRHVQLSASSPPPTRRLAINAAVQDRHQPRQL